MAGRNRPYGNLSNETRQEFRYAGVFLSGFLQVKLPIAGNRTSFPEAIPSRLDLIPVAAVAFSSEFCGIPAESGRENELQTVDYPCETRYISRLRSLTLPMNRES